MNDNMRALTEATAYLSLTHLEAKNEVVNYVNTHFKQSFTPLG